MKRPRVFRLRTRSGTPRRALWPIGLVALLTLVACGAPPGTPCAISGSGFTASDDCRHRCLSRWQLTCPGGERVTPGTCSGAFGCEPGGCPEGQVCYYDDDPFDDRSFCVMADSCGSLDAKALREWELERVAAQAAVREERAAKEARRAKWRSETPHAGKVAAAAEPAEGVHVPAIESDARSTGAFRPPASGDADDIDADGRAWLRLIDFELTPPESGARARFKSMRFQACLTWPHPTPAQAADWEARSEASRREHDARDADYTAEEREAIGRCGLNLARHRLEAFVMPRTLVLDIDGDEAGDAVFPVRREGDGAAMLALCRAGTWLELLGPEHALFQDPDLAHLLRVLETWRVVPRDHGSFGYLDEALWPDPEGDAFVLERIEKGLGIVYWRDGELQAQSVYRFVEP